jgi:hypothetical protein
MTLLSHRRNPNAEIGAGVDHQLHAAQHFGCFIAQAHAAKRGDRAAGAVACAAQLPKNMGHSLELPRAPASGRSMPRARVIAQLPCSLWEPNPRSQSILGKPRPEPASAADLRPPPDGSYLGPAGCQSAELHRAPGPGSGGLITQITLSPAAKPSISTPASWAQLPL